MPLRCVAEIVGRERLLAALKPVTGNSRLPGFRAQATAPSTEVLETAQ
jgi:hypothetical protein